MSTPPTGPGSSESLSVGGGEGILAPLLGDERLARAIAMGVPSFVRRAQAVEHATVRLEAAIRLERAKRLQTLLPAARVLEQHRVRGDALPAAVVRLLDELRADPNFEKRTPPPARDVRRVLRDLAQRVSRFNQRWHHYLESISLEEVHKAQSKYNRYYALEREMALRALPPKPFTPVELLDRDALRARWPLLLEFN